MAYTEKREGVHRLTLEGRHRLTVSGVEDVESFDESAISMTTCEGTLSIHGSELHIEKLSLDGGDLLVEGKVESLSYEDPGNNQGGLLSRLFRT